MYRRYNGYILEMMGNVWKYAIRHTDDRMINMCIILMLCCVHQR